MLPVGVHWTTWVRTDEWQLMQVLAPAGPRATFHSGWMIAGETAFAVAALAA